MHRAVLATLAIAVCGAGGAAAWAAFFASTTSSGNSAATATSFAHLNMATGTYTGNGADGRAIGSLSFSPDLVIVKAATAQIGVFRTSSMTGDASKPAAGATALTANLVESLTATGFTVGTSNQVNQNGTTYTWAAFDETAGVLDVGVYPGNGTSQSLTGLGFSPELAIAMAANANRAVLRTAGMSRSYRFDGDTGATNRFTSLDADGATIGNAAEVNSNGIAYHYVALNERAAVTDVGSYAGNGATRNITGLGFQPAWVMVRADDTVTARNGRYRTASTAAGNSHFFLGTADGTGALSALISDGFSLGTSTDVNASGVTNYYVALRQR